MEQNGNYKNNLIVDLSPFFYFEAAGDSEGDLDQYHHPHHHHHSMMMMMGLGGHDDHQEEDAQSCSYDAWEVHANTPSSHDNNNINNDACGATTHRTTIDQHHSYYEHHVDVDDDDDDDDGKLFMDSKMMMMMNSKKACASYSREDYKCTSSEVMSTANSNSSRKSCIDASEGKKLSEKERSRLFWETCLAS